MGGRERLGTNLAARGARRSGSPRSRRGTGTAGGTAGAANPPPSTRFAPECTFAAAINCPHSDDFALTSRRPTD